MTTMMSVCHVSYRFCDNNDFVFRESSEQIYFVFNTERRRVVQGALGHSYGPVFDTERRRNVQGASGHSYGPALNIVRRSVARRHSICS
jgi:RNA binding exosome subunit